MHRDLRNRFLEKLAAEKATAVIPSGGLVTRNADSEHRFRPTGDFYYLTGFAEPDSVLVLCPHGEEVKSILFLREKDPKAETWTGRRLGVDAAPEALGVDLALPISELWEKLPEYLKGAPRVVWALGLDEELDRKITAAVIATRGLCRDGSVPPREWIDPSVWLHEQRLRKTSGEIELIRKAAEITTEAYLRAMKETEPGGSETEIEASFLHSFRRRGGTGEAYNTIVAGGENACILHYIENDQPLRDGDLLLIDAGCEYGYYASDVTRTFPVNGRFTEAQRAIYEVVLAAQLAALEISRPGTTMAAVHEAATRRLAEGLVELGLIEGPVEKALEEKTFEPFTIHKTGHWLGLDVHDCGVYYLDGKPRPLEEGMVFTIEPGIYISEDDESVEERWRGIGVRIEDDVLITAEGHENLTLGIPKSADDVEKACGRALTTPQALK
jgi:Xaa-Pro aminopeptidase